MKSSITKICGLATLVLSGHTFAIDSDCDVFGNTTLYHVATMNSWEQSFPYTRTNIATSVVGPISPWMSDTWNAVNSWHIFIDMPAGQYAWAGESNLELGDVGGVWEAVGYDSCVDTHVVELTSVGVNTSAGVIGYISNNLSMPSIQFSASVSPSNTALSDLTFHWYLELNYTSNGNSYSHRIPASGTVNITGNNTWQPNWNGLLAGGNDLTVYVSASAPGSSIGPIPKGGFAIHGEDPTASQIASYAGTSPWFLTRMIMQESSNRQFSGGIGLPLVGGVGYGLMQVDNPSPSEAAKWNWQQNITEGVSILNGKYSEAVSWYDSQVAQWATYNASNPPVASPSSVTYGSITYSYSPTGGEKPLTDGIWIKMYNGASPHWLAWQNTQGVVPYWQVNDSAGYVQAVSTAL